jgi:hypothetical protein
VLVGHKVRDVDFTLRRQSRYQALVDKIRDGQIDVSERPTRFDVDKSLGYVGFARRTTGGVLRVEFFWGSAFPVKHTAYIYTSTGRPDDGAWDRWRYRAVADRWFDASD